MVEQVERKLEEFERAKKDVYYKEKEQDLLAWGLTIQTQGKKTVPIIVTDEEYEALKQAAKGTEFYNRSKSKMGQLLTIIGIIIAVAGFVAGLVMYSVIEDLSLVTLSLCWGGSLALCCIFVGLAEVINLLNRLIEGK